MADRKQGAGWSWGSSAAVHKAHWEKFLLERNCAPLVLQKHTTRWCCTLRKSHTVKWL